MPPLEVGVRCGQCGGEVYMTTCWHLTGRPHEWVIYSDCLNCGLHNDVESGCLDCSAIGEEHAE